MIPMGALRRVVQMNPVTPLIEVYRDVVLLGRIPALLTWGWATAVALVSWVVGAWIFSRLRETIAETV
jgi:homopolymeric O-antigen transport system permease protein